MLIVFEGLDQSGKATQTRHLRARLEQDGRKVHSASFPDYDTPIGQEIAKALRGERDFSPDVMQLLYIANRLEYKPRFDLWLGVGNVVIADRYGASSIAYGEAQGLDPAWLEQIQRYLPTPLITVMLDISPETAMKRKRKDRDRYERDTELLRRVRDSYKRQAAQHGWVVIDGEKSKDEVSEAVEKAVLSRLEPVSARARS